MSYDRRIARLEELVAGRSKKSALVRYVPSEEEMRGALMMLNDIGALQPNLTSIPDDELKALCEKFCIEWKLNNEI